MTINVYLMRDNRLPIQQLNAQNKCSRCWRCCVTEDKDIDWQQFNRDFELPTKWLRFSGVAICPFLTATDDLPSCLIYSERPEMCQITFCNRMTKT